MLTPLPGSKDHLDLHLGGGKLDEDLNRYDLEHVTTAHPQMGRSEWQAAYDRAWSLYYSAEHTETLIKRAIGSGINPARLTSMIFTFYASHEFEKSASAAERLVSAQASQGPPHWTAAGTVACFLRPSGA